MIKKRVALFFILLANIFLLAHIIVPHHYHNSIVSISNMLFQTNNDIQKHSYTKNEHEIKRKSDIKNCLFPNAVFFSSNTTRLIRKHTESNGKSIILFHFYANLLKTKYDLFDTTREISLIPPFKILPEQIKKYIIGLRAPPIV